MRLSFIHTIFIKKIILFSSSGGAHVQLKVAGDIERFTNMDIESFRQILAENCGNRIRYTNLTGINNGCVELSFKVPASYISVLLKDAKNGAEWLVGNGVFQVNIDGEETVDLPKRKQEEPTPGTGNYT